MCRFEATLQEILTQSAWRHTAPFFLCSLVKMSSGNSWMAARYTRFIKEMPTKNWNLQTKQKTERKKPRRLFLLIIICKHVLNEYIILSSSSPISGKISDRQATNCSITETQCSFCSDKWDRKWGGSETGSCFLSSLEFKEKKRGKKELLMTA